MLFLIIRRWVRRSYPEEYSLTNPGNKEINRITAFLDALRFRVLDCKFGSRMMNCISKDVARGLIFVILFMMVMILLATMMMVMMAIFSVFVVTVRYNAMDQR